MNGSKLINFFYRKNTHLQEVKISVKFKKMIEKHIHLLEFKVGHSCRYFLAVKGILCKKF
jgi:hypothetical protein